MIEQDGSRTASRGARGLDPLAPHVAVVVVVDMLRLRARSTTAVEAGATVVPARWADEQAAAPRRRERCRPRRSTRGRPPRCRRRPADAAAGRRLVLPSPNGATIGVAGPGHPGTAILAGCLRNATATARRARSSPPGPDRHLAAGEPLADGSLRHADGGPARGRSRDPPPSTSRAVSPPMLPGRSRGPRRIRRRPSDARRAPRVVVGSRAGRVRVHRRRPHVGRARRHRRRRPARRRGLHHR